MRYLITFSYDGSKYFGYQKQKNKQTIQEEIEQALTKINSNQKVYISASGRTDKGVHAINQKAHFDLIGTYDIDKLKNSINKMLPNSIFIRKLQIVNDNFHARFDVLKKIYTYKINVGEYDPIQKDYIYQYNKRLDLVKMREAAKTFIGEHDFTSYTKDASLKESCVRTIYSIDININNDIVSITFTGNGFLRYMVRNLVSSLIDAGSSKIEISEIKEILASKNRNNAGVTAPACGLYLEEVLYN